MRPVHFLYVPNLGSSFGLFGRHYSRLLRGEYQEKSILPLKSNGMHFVGKENAQSSGEIAKMASYTMFQFLCEISRSSLI